MRCPFAEWRGPVPNETPGGMESPVVGVVFHIMGSSFSAADGWFHNPSAKASAHFGIKQDGGLVQWVDTADRAWHAVAANRHWIGVETEGTGGPLSEAGCQTFARLYRWLHDTHGVPFEITDDPSNGHGFGWHGMGGAAWGGHDYCPGPERRAQRAHILQLAQGIAPGPPPEEDMPLALVTDRLGYGPDQQCTIDLENLKDGAAGLRQGVVRIPWDFVGGPRTHRVRVVQWDKDGKVGLVAGAPYLPNSDEIDLTAAHTLVLTMKPEYVAVSIQSKAPTRDEGGDTDVRTVLWG